MATPRVGPESSRGRGYFPSAPAVVHLHRPRFTVDSRPVTVAPPLGAAGCLSEPGEGAGDWGDGQDGDETVESGTAATHTSGAQDDSVFPLAPGKVLCLLGERNPLRLACAHTIAHPHFDNTVLVLIVLSSLLLALDDPLMAASPRRAIA